jgi:hypothetical protein
MRDLRFYEAAAQVLPVLALVAIVEGRAVPARAARRGAFPHVLYGLLVMAAGEWLALRTLLRGHANATDKAWVVGALVYAGGSIMVPAFREVIQEFVQSRSTKSSREWAFEAVAALAPLAVIAYIVFSS